MAFYDLAWYVNAGDQVTTGYWAVPKWAASTAYAAGAMRRQNIVPAINSERVFACIIAGTSAASEAGWNLTRGAKTTDGSVTWMEATGIAGLNGDSTNMVTWAQAKGIGTPSLGAVIKRNNGASYQICTTAGTMGATEPAFSDTAGVTATEVSATSVWTSLGVVGNFTKGMTPHARIQNPFGSFWYQPGNFVYVADNHQEVQTGAMTIGATGGVNGQIAKVICHNRLGNYPPQSSDLATSATALISGNNTFTLSSNGSTYFYGITFKAGAPGVGTGNMMVIQVAGANNQGWLLCENCSFQLITNISGAYIMVGAGSGFSPIKFINCTVLFSNVGQFLNCGSAKFYWSNTKPILAGGSSVPNTGLFQFSANNVMLNHLLEALDLSQISAPLFAFSTSFTQPVGSIQIQDCKLSSAAMIPVPQHTSLIVQLTRSSS